MELAKLSECTRFFKVAFVHPRNIWQTNDPDFMENHNLPTENCN